MKQSLLYILLFRKNLIVLALKGPHIIIYMLHIDKNHIILVFHALKILHAQTFCGKPETLYSTQYSVVFVTYSEGLNMHIGQPSPQSIVIEYT